MQRSAISCNWLYMLSHRFKSPELFSDHFVVHKKHLPSSLLKKSFIGSLSFQSLVLSKGYSNKTSLLVRKMSTRSSISVEKQTGPESKVEHVGLLDTVEDLHGGVIVEMKDHIDSQIFLPLLSASISQWRHQGKKGVWIKLPIQLSNLVDPIVKAGFRYHHAEPDYLMLVKWLSSGPDTFPINASHRVGIGAFIMNNNREILVVQERSGGFKGTGVWKLPTGVVNEGEDICKAAVREVEEETGIDAEFVEVLAFRQSHQSFFGKSDLFFVCMLRPNSFDIKIQDSEIEAAQWMPVEEYVNQPFNQKNKLFRYIAEICKTKSETEYSGFAAVASATSSGKETHLYFNTRDFSSQVTL